MLSHDFVEHREDLRVRSQFLDRFEGHALVLGPLLKTLGARRDQHHQVGAAVADDDRVVDQGRTFEFGLDGLWCDVLAAGGDDDVLLAVGDADEAVVVDLGDVAGEEEAVAVKDLRGLVREVPVALHDRRALDAELAVVGDLDLDVGDRPADGAEPGHSPPVMPLTANTGEVSVRP